MPLWPCLHRMIHAHERKHSLRQGHLARLVSSRLPLLDSPLESRVLESLLCSRGLSRTTWRKRLSGLQRQLSSTISCSQLVSKPGQLLSALPGLMAQAVKGAIVGLASVIQRCPICVVLHMIEIQPQELAMLEISSCLSVCCKSACLCELVILQHSALWTGPISFHRLPPQPPFDPLQPPSLSGLQSYQ